jgi:hypothetical protein
VTHGDVWLLFLLRLPVSYLPISSFCASRCPRSWAATVARLASIPSPTCGYSYAGAPTRTFDPLATARVDIERYVRWLQDVRRHQPSTVSRRLSVVVGFYQGAVHDADLVNAPAADRGQGEERAEGVDHPVRRGVGHPEQRPDLTHCQVRTPVDGDEQNPVRQVQRPLPTRPSISDLVPASPGDQPHQAPEQDRLQLSERVDPLRPRRRDHLRPNILNDHGPPMITGLRDSP